MPHPTPHTLGENSHPGTPTKGRGAEFGKLGWCGLMWIVLDSVSCIRTTLTSSRDRQHALRQTGPSAQCEFLGPDLAVRGNKAEWKQY